MNLRPLGSRVLIQPIPNDDHTESGLVLVEHRKPETMGTVIAVGECAHPLKAAAESVAAGLEDMWRDDGGAAFNEHEAARLLRALVARAPLVKIGDTVIFPWTAGREISLDDGPPYLMMNESDILAILET